MTNDNRMPFVRFHALKRGDVTKILNQIIPGQWVYSHYALTPAQTVSTGLHAGGTSAVAPKPIMVLLKDAAAGTLVSMFFEKGWQDDQAVTIKQIDMLLPHQVNKGRVLYRYGGELTHFPWEASEGEG